MEGAGALGRQDAAEESLKGKRIERGQHDGRAQGRPSG
jgi:hypothetical protein